MKRSELGFTASVQLSRKTGDIATSLIQTQTQTQVFHIDSGKCLTETKTLVSVSYRHRHRHKCFTQTLASVSRRQRLWQVSHGARRQKLWTVSHGDADTDMYLLLLLIALPVPSLGQTPNFFYCLSPDFNIPTTVSMLYKELGSGHRC